MAETDEARGTYREFYTAYVERLALIPSNEWFSCRCPFHEDDRASAAISETTGVFKCFVCGNFSPAHFLHRLLGITIEEGHRLIDLFRRERQLTEKINTFVNYLPVPNPRFNTLAELSRQLMGPDHQVVQWYLEARALKYETLIERGVGYLPAQHTNWHRDSLVFPYYLNGRCTGIRYRDEGGNKGGEKDCYFALWGIDLIEDDTPIAIMAEGETDALRIHQAIHGRYPVLCTPTAGVRREWKRELDSLDHLIVLPQVDEASVKMVDKVLQWFDQADVVELPWRRRQVGNDVCDWLRYHSEEELDALIESRVDSRRRRKVLTGDEFEAEASKPRKWLIENLLSMRQVVMIGGLPKSKKTWIMLNLVRSILTGRPFCEIEHLKPIPQEEPIRLLIWEEEGAIEELYERVKMVLGDTEWKRDTFWAHRLGLRLDEDGWLAKLDKEITEKSIGILLLDPFSRTYAVDEDSASEMGKVWSRVQTLLTTHENLVIVILHHFSKAGVLNDRWKAFRGSGRTAAEADLGIFVETLPTAKGNGCQVVFDGRGIRPITNTNGEDIFVLDFEEGVLKARKVKKTVNQAQGSESIDLVGYLLEVPGHSCLVQEAADDLGTSAALIIRRSTESLNNQGEKIIEIETRDDGDWLVLHLDRTDRANVTN